MDNEKQKDDQAQKRERTRYTVHLPGFITKEDIGLGDVIKGVTSAAGIRPCGKCEQRATALNRWFVFSGRRPK